MRDSVSSVPPRAEPVWQAEGWSPLLSSKVYSAGERRRITGDLGEEFQELYLPTGETVDAHGTILVRANDGKPDIFDVTFLRSDHFGVHVRKCVGFGTRIAPVGEEIILKAAGDDFAANYAVGHYVLWKLDDPAGARSYLEFAVTGGIEDALFDLAIVELFSARK
jgi:hypothetical protein